MKSVVRFSANIKTLSKASCYQGLILALRGRKQPQKRRNRWKNQTTFPPTYLTQSTGFELTLFCCFAVKITISPIIQRYNFEFISTEFTTKKSRLLSALFRCRPCGQMMNPPVRARRLCRRRPAEGRRLRKAADSRTGIPPSAQFVRLILLIIKRKPNKK